MRDRQVLAGSLLPGDRLLAATLGGSWDAEVLGMKAVGTNVELVLAGHAQTVTICAFDVCQIRRADEAGTPAERAAWQVDAEACEVTP